MTTTRTIAEAIREGNFTLLPRVEHQLYETADWQGAADYALDCDDLAELDHMIAREVAWDEFDGNGGLEREDFDGWLFRKAAWDPDRYDAAVDMGERELIAQIRSAA